MTMPENQLLSAYLAGDLGAAEAAAFEERLARDPDLAARLEALHDALVRLGGLDEVEPPEGYAERLHARIEEETGAAAAAAHERTGGAVIDMTAERARRRPIRWAPLGAVAAGIATLAVVVTVVGPPGAGDEDMAAAPTQESAALEAPDDEMGMTLDDARVERGSGGLSADEAGEAGQGEPGAPAGAGGADGEAADTFAGDGDEAPAPEPAQAPQSSMESDSAAAPVIVDSEVPLADEPAVRERYDGLPEAERLLGLSRAEAEDRAAAARFSVQRAEPFRSGVHPSSCLDVVSGSTDAPVVVARVESAVHDGVPALVYVTVTASRESDVLDRIEAWVVESETCGTRLYITLT